MLTQELFAGPLPGPGNAGAAVVAPGRAMAPAESAQPVSASLVAPADGPEAGGGTEKSGRARGMAVAGKPVSVQPMPPTPTWPQAQSADETYVPDETVDVSDLSEVNRMLNGCRARLFRVSRAYRQAQRDAADADLTYRRQLRRTLVRVSGGSAETRKALAELECEPWENALVVANQVVEELKKLSIDARDDLKAVENLSHNVRAQMDVR